MQLSIKEALKFGWSAFKKNWILIWTLMAIIFVFELIFSSLSLQENLIVLISGFLLQIVIGIALLQIFFQFYAKIQSKITDILSIKLKTFFYYLLTTILIGILVSAFTFSLIRIFESEETAKQTLEMLAFFLICFPLFVKFIFAQCYCLDEQCSPFSALLKSYQITKGHFWKISLFLFVLLLLNILGFLAFFVGILITLPISQGAIVYFYRQLVPEELIA